MAKDIGIIFCPTFMFFINWLSHRNFQFMNAEILNLYILFFVFLLSAKHGDWAKKVYLHPHQRVALCPRF